MHSYIFSIMPRPARSRVSKSKAKKVAKRTANTTTTNASGVWSQEPSPSHPTGQDHSQLNDLQAQVASLQQELRNRTPPSQPKPTPWADPTPGMTPWLFQSPPLHPMAPQATATPFQPPSQPQPQSWAATPPANSPSSTPLVTMSIPLHTYLSQEVSNKIAKDQFVDFYSLLHPSEAKTLAMIPQDLGEGMVATFSEVQPKSRPMTLLSWCKAFARFGASYVRSHSQDQAGNLFSYLDNILDLAKEGADWADYDLHFRQQMASKLYGLGHVRSELYSAYLAKPKSNPCPGALPSPTTAQCISSKHWVPRGYCIAFHLKGQHCSSPSEDDCQYSHQCFLCEQASHPAYSCSSMTKE